MTEQNPRHIFERAVSLLKAGARGEAESLCREAIDRDPGDINFVSLLGSILADGGNLEEAAELLHRAVKVAPGHSRAQEDLGTILLNLDRVEEALPYLERAKGLQTSSASILNKLSGAYQKLGRDADTIRNEVAAGQQSASGDVQAHQAEVTGAVEEKQGETKVGRVLGSATEDLIEDPIHLGRELLRQNEEPEQPDDWVFRQQGLSGRRDEAALKPQADSETTPTSTSDGSGAAEHQQRNLWLPKGMGMPQRGNNRRCAINCGVIRRSAGICDPISSRICTASNRSKSGLGLNCRAHQSAVA